MQNAKCKMQNELKLEVLSMDGTPFLEFGIRNSEFGIDWILGVLSLDGAPF